MGTIEKILQLSEQTFSKLNFMNERIALLENELKNASVKDKLIVEFTGNDRLNVSMASKVIGIKQNEFLKLVRRGKIVPTGSKKYFLAKEILRYIETGKDPLKAQQVYKKKSAKKTQNIINDKELRELAEMQDV